MPDTNHYVTYDGSFTYPGCEETVTWIIMNRPLHITLQQVCTFLLSLTPSLVIEACLKLLSPVFLKFLT